MSNNTPEIRLNEHQWLWNKTLHRIKSDSGSGPPTWKGFCSSIVSGKPEYFDIEEGSFLGADS